MEEAQQDLSYDTTKQSGDAGAQHVFQVLQYLRKLVTHPALVLNPSHPDYENVMQELAASKRSLRDIGTLSHAIGRMCGLTLSVRHCPEIPCTATAAAGLWHWYDSGLDNRHGSQPAPRSPFRPTQIRSGPGPEGPLREAYADCNIRKVAATPFCNDVF